MGKGGSRGSGRSSRIPPSIAPMGINVDKVISQRGSSKGYTIGPAGTFNPDTGEWKPGPASKSK